MIPLDLLGNPSFRISAIASVCCFAGQSAAMVSLPFYLQHGLGQDALRTGLLITPWPLTVAIAAPLSGKLVERISGGVLCALGGGLLALGLTAAALWPLHGQPLALVPLLVLCGAGFGLFQVPNNRNLFLSAPRERSGAAGGMQGTARLTGQTMGAVLMTVLFTSTSLELAPRLGLGAAALLTLVAACEALCGAATHDDRGEARVWAPSSMAVYWSNEQIDHVRALLERHLHALFEDDAIREPFSELLLGQVLGLAPFGDALPECLIERFVLWRHGDHPVV